MTLQDIEILGEGVICEDTISQRERMYSPRHAPTSCIPLSARRTLPFELVICLGALEVSQVTLWCWPTFHTVSVTHRIFQICEQELSGEIPTLVWIDDLWYKYVSGTQVEGCSEGEDEKGEKDKKESRERSHDHGECYEVRVVSRI